MSVLAKPLDGLRCHLVWRLALAQAPLCSMGTQLPSIKKGTAPTQSVVAHVYCGQTAGWMKTPLSTEVDLGPGHIVLDGDPAPRERAQQPPLCGPCLLWPRSPISATAELLYEITAATVWLRLYDSLRPMFFRATLYIHSLAGATTCPSARQKQCSSPHR